MIFRDILKRSLGSMMFCDVQRCSEGRFCVDYCGLRGFLWGVLKRSWASTWELSDSESFLKVLRHSLTSWCVLGCLEVFSLVLVCSERFLKILRRYLTFWTLLRFSEVFLYNMNKFKSLLNVLRRCLMFSIVLRFTGTLSHVLGVLFRSEV